MSVETLSGQLDVDKREEVEQGIYRNQTLEELGSRGLQFYPEEWGPGILARKQKPQESGHSDFSRIESD